MDNKFHVSLEAARLLKEKGYDKDVRNFYDEEGLFLEIEGFYNFEYLTNEELDNNHYAAPTKSEAIDWLDSKEVYIQIGGVGSGETQKWSYSVFDYKTCDNYASEYIFPTRLEAEEAAIIKALELL